MPPSPALSYALATFRGPAQTPTPLWASRIVNRQKIALAGNRARITKASAGRATRDAKRSTLKADQPISKVSQIAQKEFVTNFSGPLFPTTFVALPLSSWPKQPKDFVRYLFYLIRAKASALAATIPLRMDSMPNWRSRPLFQIRKRRIVPTAKSMYNEMLEAFAAGDKATLNKICLPKLAQPLIQAIERRDPKQKMGYELLKYNKQLSYPRLLSYLAVDGRASFNAEIVLEQAVVGIASTQKAFKTDALTNSEVPGSMKIQDKIEYVVLSRQTDRKTWHSSPWRLWGLTPPTTLEGFISEQDALKKQSLHESGFKPMEKRR